MEDRMGDMSDLPEALIEQLLRNKSSAQDVILQVIKDFDGEANTDEILVGYYRKTKKVMKRIYVSNVLGKMAKSGSIISVTGRKGIYKSPNPPHNVK